MAEAFQKAGLKIQAQLDEGKYPKGLKVSDEEMKSLNKLKASKCCSRVQLFRPGM